MRSMTGFGRAEGKVGGSIVTIEVKSVNHRFLDARFRMPGPMSLLEIPLSDLLRKKFERGSCEVSVRSRPAAEGAATSSTRFTVDWAAAESFAEACDQLNHQYKTPRTPSVEAMALTGRIFVPIEESPDPNALLGELKPVFEQALEEVARMRAAEGARLRDTLRQHVAELSRARDALAALAPAHPARIRERLEARVKEWGLEGGNNAQRLELEIAYFADRADITEELDRLKAHLGEFSETLDGSRPAGRKLDFLTQELNREMNTIASKVDSTEMTRLAVEGKTLVERLREQVQNVE